MRLAVQEQHLPGGTLEEQWETAQSWGFTAIELRPHGDFAFAARLPALRRAAASGVVMRTACVEMSHFIGAFDRALGEDAIDQLASMLRTLGEIGGTGLVTPAAYGMFSRRLPPFEPPRDEAGDRAVLEDAFGRLAEVADETGVTLLLEPLNRYEDHMINTLAAARDLLDAVGSDALGICADTYHMNIEEADPNASVRTLGKRLHHVQLSDSNRLEPGAGHVDFAATLAALRAAGYTGDLAWESRLSGPAGDVLPRSTAYIRSLL